MSPRDRPHREHLRAVDNLRKNKRVMSKFRDYPNGPGGLLDGLVLRVHGFCKEDWRHGGKLHVCKDCYNSSSKNNIPGTALANGVWVGDMPRKSNGATVVERAAAYAVRMKGHVIALESRTVRNIPGSAKCSLLGTSVFHTNDSYYFGQELPLAPTGLLDMFTIVLAGNNKPTSSQLKRLLRAREHMVRDLIEYMQEKDGRLVTGFFIARQASVSETNLDTCL